MILHGEDLVFPANVFMPISIGGKVSMCSNSEIRDFRV